MHRRQSPLATAACGLLLAACLSSCETLHPAKYPIPYPEDVPTLDMPRELGKTTLPPYVIEPPDILLIDAVKVVPLPPYRVDSLDVLTIQVAGTFAEFPIAGNYGVEPGGVVNLGGPYGAVPLGGMTLEEAREAVREHLENYVQAPIVSVQLFQSSAQQLISGEHLVGPDGTVSLGVYGEVPVAGLTKPEAKQAIEAHLGRYLENPIVSVDVLSYNSKVYYVITQGAGFGDAVYRLPITGNETVLDAISQIEGLQPHSSEQMWIARPAPAGSCEVQILPVDWNAIAQGAITDTNYQLLPGDRIYVAENHWVAFDTAVGRITSPFERMFGFTLLGTSTVQELRFFHRGGQNSSN